jgi:hypothetical protein
MCGAVVQPERIFDPYEAPAVYRACQHSGISQGDVRSNKIR